MARKSRKKTDDTAPKLSLADIRGRQSVRTTFKLPKEVSEDMSWLSNYYCVTQKELIDLCVKALNELDGAPIIKNLAGIDQDEYIEASVLDGISAMIKCRKEDNVSIEDVRKTQVISRSSLSLLNDTSEIFQVPRDALVEGALRWFKAMTDRELDIHEKALGKIRDLVSKVEEIEKELNVFLEIDDPVINRLHAIKGIVDSLEMDIMDEISQGKRIDPMSI
jgi:hypothetical protein